MLFMLRKRPFTPAETDEIMSSWTLAQPVVVPGRVAASPYDVLLDGRMNMKDWDAQSPTRIGAVFDDSPFYFAIERPYGMATKIARMLFQVLVCRCHPARVVHRVWEAGKAGRSLRRLRVVLCLGFGFIGVERPLPEPDAAHRPSNLPALDPALHPAGLWRDRQRHRQGINRPRVSW
jgi:hypothetical protein